MGNKVIDYLLLHYCYCVYLNVNYLNYDNSVINGHILLHKFDVRHNYVIKYLNICILICRLPPSMI